MIAGFILIMFLAVYNFAETVTRQVLFYPIDVWLPPLFLIGLVLLAIGISLYFYFVLGSPAPPDGLF